MQSCLRRISRHVHMYKALVHADLRVPQAERADPVDPGPLRHYSSNQFESESLREGVIMQKLADRRFLMSAGRVGYW